MQKNKLLTKIVSSLLLSVTSVTAYGALTPLATQPLVSRTAVAPNILFALSVEFPTATVPAYQDLNAYTPVNEYLGYFDPQKCYLYNGTNDWFYPISIAGGRTCGSTSWSGNFLNWATMTSLDAFRYAMTGGQRYVDTGANGGTFPSYTTVLQRSLHSGQGSNFVDKSLASTNTNTILNQATPLLGSNGVATIGFSSKGRDVRFLSSRTTVSSANSLTFAQLQSTMVNNVFIEFVNNTASTLSGISYQLQIPAGLSNGAITVTGATKSYNSTTGVITLSGLTSNPASGLKQTLILSYPTPSNTTLSTVSAVMQKNSNPVGQVNIIKEHYVRAKVCDTSVGLEPNCLLYGTSSYKPVGVIQLNGDSMRFGIFSYYNANATDNVVMRSKLKTTGPQIKNGSTFTPNTNKEWSELDGTFITNPDVGLTSYTTFTDSGVVNYINKFGRSGSYKTYDDLGRLYYEALSYLRKRPADTAFYTGATSTNAENFPVVPGSAWDDPQQQSCQANYIIVIADKNTHCDMKLPGNRNSYSYSVCPGEKGSLANGDTLDVWTWTDTVGIIEGYNASTGKSLASINNNNSNSSAYIAGMSYFARINDIRPDDPAKPATTGKQSVKTFIIDVQEGNTAGQGSQLWYAAKYGGFDDINGNLLPTTFNSWAVADSSYPSAYRPKTLFPANNPKAMINAVKSALSAIAADSGSSSAAAVSSPNITPANNYVFSSTYRTSFWDGEVTAQRIDPDTGNIISANIWQASQTVSSQADSLASGNASARKLYTFNTVAVGPDKKKTFDYTSLTTAERNWFSSKCTTVSVDQFLQCNDSTLTAAQKTSADNAQNVINFIRGFNTSNAFTGPPNYGYLDIFRNNRISRLGDITNASPVYLGQPFYAFAMNTGGESYSTFKTRVASRVGTLFVGANDGFLHAFRGTDGNELFAYTPRQIMPDLYKLADNDFVSDHRYYVDATPTVMDIYDTSILKWRTILVGGLNNGGSGYYTLDVTDPSAPQALWEVCNDFTRCPTNTISTIGRSYGNPVITRMPVGSTHSGKWVVLVSSGYNNADGEGHLYVLDAVSGLLLDTYNTGNGSTGTPSGLAKISTFAPNFSNDGISHLAYAGDLDGNIWRFDLTLAGNATGAVKQIVQLKNASNTIQPVTTKIEVGAVPGHPTWPALFIGTGQYLSTNDLTNVSQQSIYGIKDPYSASISGPYTSSRGADWVQQTVTDNTVGSASIRTIDSPQSVNWVAKNGWVVDLPDTGERVALDVQLNLGTLLVSTDVVTGAGVAACQVGGTSWLYQLDYSSGSFLPNATSNQVAIQFTNALLVGNTITRLPTGALKIISTTAKGEKVSSGFITGRGTAGGRKISWRQVLQ